MSTDKREREEVVDEQEVVASSPKKPKVEDEEVAADGAATEAESGEMLECRDCQQQFCFTDGEQAFFAQKGWENKPSRCKTCSAANKLARNGGVERPQGVCYNWQRGSCDRGDSCRFTHEGAAGTGGNGGGFGGERRERRPAGVCFDFQKGRCDRGDGCRFSHDGAAGGGGGGDRRGGGDRPQGKCFDFQKGNCSRGEGCRFSHE